MTIYKYTASADNTISNAFDSTMVRRATGSNMGRSDIIEVFSLYAQDSGSSGLSTEISRGLMKFDIASIIIDRNNKVIPAAGSVNFYLNIYNCPHSSTTPEDFKYTIAKVSSDWEEGYGLDMDEYTDYTFDGIGSTWNERKGDDVSEITKVTFTSNTKSSYAAAAGANYIKIYDGSSAYNFYFKASGADGAGSLSSTTEIDISSISPENSGSIAAAFRTAANNHANFSASITDNIVYVTSSTTGPMTASSEVGTLAGLAVAVQQSGSLVTPWTNYGGDFSIAAGDFVDVSFAKGTEDISVDVTDIVESWITSISTNHGFMIKLSSSYEPYHSASDGTSTAVALHNLTGAERSYYTKKFFGRGTEFYFKKPSIEARWDDSRQDNRANFYFSSSVAPAASNKNTLYYYNYIRGKLEDIAGSDSAVPSLKLYHSSGSVPEESALSFRDSSNAVVTSVTATRVSKGVYKAQLVVTGAAVTTTYPYLVDVWSYSSAEVHTGSYFEPKSFATTNDNPTSNYSIAITNMKSEYGYNDVSRFRLYIRDKNWSPSIYTKAQTTPERKIIESGSYSVVRVADDKEVIPYGTGSLNYTPLSYDSSGNYFDLNMSLLEPGYIYGLKFTFYEDSVSDYVEQPYLFKFRVNKNVN